MKPYEQLTRQGKLRRLHKLAEEALVEYGLDGAPLKCFYSAGNTLFKVYHPRPESNPVDEELFIPCRFLLRIYAPGWQTPEAIELELAWLNAMRKDAGLPVPEPVKRLDGTFLTRIDFPGVPGTRSCAMLRWIKGRLLGNNGKPEHYRLQGQLLARMHNFTQVWQRDIAPGDSKRRYDWDGLFMNDPEIGLQPGESWNYLPLTWEKPFKEVAARYRRLIKTWGTDPDVYGLIHADMGLDANLLFWKGQPRPIDFDGSGWGYWMYDLATAVAHLVGLPEHYPYWNALLDGYLPYRTLPEDQLAQFELFTAAFYVYFILWMVGVEHLHPGWLQGDMEELMYRGTAFIFNFVGVHNDNGC